MKEIIKQGKTEKYIHTCGCCGCTFSYEHSDVIGLGTVLCPNCKNSQTTAKDTLYEKTSEQQTPKYHLCANVSVSQIAKMQQQIDTFKAALLHASERILHANKCNMVVIDPLDDCDKQNINTIFKFIDEHLNDKSSCANAQKTTY